LSGFGVHVSYFPPGTSKWHAVGCEIFCFVSNVDKTVTEGVSSVSVEADVKLISCGVALKKLKLVCVMGDERFALGLNVTIDENSSSLHLVCDEFCRYWNYVIYPE